VAIFGSVILVLSIIVAIVFSLLVLVTGKGDAMSGGGSVRTTYKGKATFDDLMSRATLILGISFMVLVLLYNVVVNRSEKEKMKASIPQQSSQKLPDVKGPDLNAPANNAPATNAPAPDTNAPAASNSPADANTPKK
jgi:protein translocase SecG subunit